MQGVVLQTYGAGNGPDSNKELLNVFTQAANRGLLIINITQCIRGTVKASYAVGKVKCTLLIYIAQHANFLVLAQCQCEKNT